MFIFICWALIFIVENISLLELIGISCGISIPICLCLSSIKYTFDGIFTVPELSENYLIGLPLPVCVIEEGRDYLIGFTYLFNLLFSFLLGMVINVLIIMLTLSVVSI